MAKVKEITLKSPFIGDPKISITAEINVDSKGNFYVSAKKLPYDFAEYVMEQGQDIQFNPFLFVSDTLAETEKSINDAFIKFIRRVNSTWVITLNAKYLKSGGYACKSALNFEYSIVKLYETASGQYRKYYEEYTGEIKQSEKNKIEEYQGIVLREVCIELVHQEIIKEIPFSLEALNFCKNVKQAIETLSEKVNGFIASDDFLEKILLSQSNLKLL